MKRNTCMALSIIGMVATAALAILEYGARGYFALGGEWLLPVALPLYAYVVSIVLDNAREDVR